ncbi:ankyrin repeat domain-containing protein [Oceanicoccus sp. KOV_DT_Chl]|uniref:ankyrin repeat domain-containing protein n=1 Tax=Oceanicoccus sp. KOV_DT_Chl TaxID=1904639 RepID=UPI000C7C90BB|nr:ankyrin repeat domain-containing protein [Oceanicoccus sp. KOV_DT_Chl]
MKAALAEGADPNGWIDQEQKTPLIIIAALWADPDSIKALLAAGANPNSRAKSRNKSVENPSPLDMLAFSENERALESIDVLIAAGANVEDSMLLSGACWRGDIVFYQRIKKLAGLLLADADNNNCLHHAAKMNRVELLSFLLISDDPDKEAFNALLAAVNQQQNTPLDIAIVYGHTEAALIIMSAAGVSNNPQIERYLRRLPASPSAVTLRNRLMPATR